MTYSHQAAKAVALEWGLGLDEIDNWAEAGVIPDELALHKNDQTAERIGKYEQLILLCAQGYVKSEYICKHFNWSTRRISNILSYVRNPEEVYPRKLYGEEIDAVHDELLQPLRSSLESLLADAWTTLPSEAYTDELQQRLAHLVADHPIINPSRLSMGLTDSQRAMLRSLLNGNTPRIYGKNKDVFTHALTECQRIVSILKAKPTNV